MNPPMNSESEMEASFERMWKEWMAHSLSLEFLGEVKEVCRAVYFRGYSRGFDKAAQQSGAISNAILKDLQAQKGNC